jgi:6-phosphogluconolactonase
MTQIARKPELLVLSDADALAVTAAQTIAGIASASIGQRGRFACALTGGSTPRATYRRRATKATGLDWSHTWLFFGDERFVPPDDERSNYQMARDTLLGPAKISQDHVFPIPTGPDSIDACARRYTRTLQTFFDTAEAEPPVFDLMLLGLGDDGHVASLFPRARTLGITDATVAWSAAGTLPPHVDRITITFPVINAARHVMFLVAGANKAEAVRDVLLGVADVDERPAAGVRPQSGHVTWLLDRAAASLLPSDFVQPPRTPDGRPTS